MTKDHITQIANLYDSLLEEHGIKVRSAPLDQLRLDHPHSYLEHCRWMCQEIPRMERDKAMRWLCFVQGVIWVLAMRTIDQMRDDNRAGTSSAG